MKVLYRILADIIWLLHAVIFFTLAFGWLFPSIWYLYMSLLFATLATDVFLKECVVSKWEFDLRKKVNPHINYNYSFSSYYTYKLTNHRISDSFILIAGVFFTAASILINLYFHLT